MAKVKIIPKSLPGWWSVGFIFLAAILVYLSTVFAQAREFVSPGEPLPHRPIVALLMWVSIISGIAAFLSGLFGILKKKDYSVLVILTTLIGLFVLLAFIQQALFPQMINLK